MIKQLIKFILNFIEFENIIKFVLDANLKILLIIYFIFRKDFEFQCVIPFCHFQ